MAGGLLNLVAEGDNNVFVTGNPTKTFFRTAYAKHTNFGLQKFRIDYEGLRDLRLTEPSTFTFKIPRYADLLMDTYLVLSLPDIWSPIYAPCSDTSQQWAPYEFEWIKDLGCNLLLQAEITCGNTTIARFSGDYLRNMVERDFPIDKKNVFYRMTGNVPELNAPAAAFSRTNVYPSAYYTGSSIGAEPSIRGRNVYVPINCWFTLSSAMALPLVALQYSEVHITVTLRPINQLFRVRDVFDPYNGFPYVAPDFTQQQFQFYRFLQTPPAEIITQDVYLNQLTNWNADVHLLSTYCFLSSDEARQFASQPQTYLVKDVAEYSFNNVTGTQKLSLGSNGMVSSWMMFCQRNDVNLRNEWSNYTNWPYGGQLPYNVQIAPATSETVASEIYTDLVTRLPLNTGPQFNTDGTATNIFTSGDFAAGNVRDILTTMAVMLDGSYRENTLERGVFDYVEKYTRTSGDCHDGLYCYNFCLNNNPFHAQPSGAINMSRFRTVELEISTILPQVDATGSVQNVVCDVNGNLVGLRKQNWRLFEYTYNVKIMEERYNLVYFEAGNCGLMFAR